MPIMAFARSAPASQPNIRHHLGDDPVWAHAEFDDGGWPEGQNGGFLAPEYDSNGSVWVRSQVVAVPAVSGLLAIESQTVDAAPHVQEIWVNGRLVGRYGDFPPSATSLISPKCWSSIFPRA
ncbi:MAG TPA: hypothetical protein VGF88_20100 [Acidobacteriaceae bacterium]